MTVIPFTFLVLRYVHDRGAGECLNIGVVLYSGDADFIATEFEHRYERLSQTFRGFNGEHYRRALARLKVPVMRIQREWRETPLLRAKPEHVHQVLAEIFVDEDTSFQWSEPLSGVTHDLHDEVRILFDRMVKSQYPQGEEFGRRDDDALWKRVYQRALPDRVLQRMRPKRFVTPHLDIEFEHALRNGAWHVVQPLSMDYKSADTMQKKATQWVGTSVGLQGASELAKMYFLLGKPGGNRHRKAYARVKKLLDQAPIAHEVIEENDATALARSLGALVPERDEEP